MLVRSFHLQKYMGQRVKAWNEKKPIFPSLQMDASLATLKACTHLSLSSNNIDKISSLAGETHSTASFNDWACRGAYIAAMQKQSRSKGTATDLGP
jgi:Leucine-rich repeat (LRR) protein